MAKVVFKSYNPNDNLLLPPCLDDYPRNHPARVVSAIIDRLDISEIESGYAGGGTSSYNPRMLLNIIVYTYLNNVYSGRQMEKLLVENIVNLRRQVPRQRDAGNGGRGRSEQSERSPLRGKLLPLRSSAHKKKKRRTLFSPLISSF